jgi:hypothetical protein
MLARDSSASGAERDSSAHESASKKVEVLFGHLLTHRSLLESPRCHRCLVRPALLCWSRVHDSTEAFHGEKFICQVRGLSWRRAKRFVLTTKIVMEKVERQRRAIVRDHDRRRIRARPDETVVNPFARDVTRMAMRCSFGLVIPFTGTALLAPPVFATIHANGLRRRREDSQCEEFSQD